MSQEHIEKLMLIKALSRSDIPTSECEVILDRLMKYDPTYLDGLMIEYNQLNDNINKELAYAQREYEHAKIRIVHAYSKATRELKIKFAQDSDSVLKDES